MKILINSKHFNMSEFKLLITHLDDVTFTDDFNDLDIDAMITWPSAIRADILDQYPDLKLIMLPSAGYDKADLSYLKKRQIVLTNARGVYDIQIAEDVLSKILYFNRNMRLFQENMNQSIWHYEGSFAEIYGSTVGIIGAGSIGQRIAKVMKGFDAHVIGYRRNEEPLPDFNQIYTGDKGLQKLLKVSDYVILAVPLNDKTTYLIDEDALRLMKKNALIINIARGKVIEQNALIKALNEGWIRGAALDVTEIEPLPSESPLWHAKNLFISPHVAGSSPKAHTRVNALLERLINQFRSNEPIDNRIC